MALDDFGAGYTSFRHLKALTVDVVKIDGSFVRDIATNRDNRLFVRTLVGLAQGFGLETVAECVENKVSADILAEEGGRLPPRLLLRPSGAGAGLAAHGGHHAA